jgi:hypothetical protein
MHALGCATDDWRLAASQQLDPALGSAYVARLRGTRLQRLYRMARRQVRQALGV